jgi:hypothetical protein
MDYAAQQSLWGLVVMLVVAVGMFAFGWWGRRRSGALLASEVRSRQRAVRERQLHRGAVVWQVVAVLFAVIAVAGMVTLLAR